MHWGNVVINVVGITVMVLWLSWAAFVIWGPDWANMLIRRAKRTPYSHLPGYMNRFWLVPFRRSNEVGCGPVRLCERPIAWALQQFDVAVRVHEILRSDEERHPHNHPWPYIRVILRNGYMEESYNYEGELVDVRPTIAGDVAFRSARSLHKLWLMPGVTATTLFISFRKTGHWGFLVNRKIVPWREYLGEQ